MNENAAPAGQGKSAPQPAPRAQTSLLHDVLSLLIKVIVIGLFFWLFFTFIYGVFRCNDIGMKPAVKDGDLVLFYRLDKDVVASEVVALRYQGSEITGRVIAVAGDTVDITENGLLVNGSRQQESDIYADTTQFTGGVTFPLTVGEGKVFLLGDNRAQATDSRIFGCVDTADLDGTVIGILRRRGI